MAIDKEKYIQRIHSGKYSRKELENLRNNASSKTGMDDIIEACNEELSYGTGNINPDTREIGFQETLRELKRRGGLSVKTLKEGNKSIVNFESLNGKKYEILTRSKKAGTWQTTIDYAEKATKPDVESEFWVLVDLEFSPPKFYITPAWWIKNDIWEIHTAYLRQNGGKRARNNDSKHHAITVDRVKKWESCWELIGLPEE